MNFVYKLFPYRSLFVIDEETLTAWWVVAILLFLLFFVIRLLLVTRRLQSNLRKLLSTESFEEVQRNKLFATIWQDYYRTFFNLNDKKRTNEYSYDYFNEKNLLAANTNIKLIASIPNLLIGFGILGTFVGLTFGISNFNTGTTQQIQESIQTLLSGMGTAFVSSIWGMSASLLFTFFERAQVDSLYNSIHQFCYKLDRKYKISKEDERSILIFTFRQLLTEYFVFKDDSNNAVKPSNVLRDIYQESRKQSAALQSFSTDLAGLIEAGFEKILNDPEKGVTYELQALKDEIISLGKKLQDPATEMTQNVVKELEQSMAKMVEEFKHSVSGSAKAELESLIRLLSQTGDTLGSMPKMINSMIEAVQLQVQTIGEAMNRNVIGLQQSHERLIEKQSENIKLSDDLLGVFNRSVENLNTLTLEVSETLAQFNNVKRDLNTISQQLKDVSDNVLVSTSRFQESQNGFSEYTNRFLKSNAETITEMRNTLSQAREVAEDYAIKFEVIESGLQNVFAQIQTGLLNYRNTIGESLDSYLGRYSEALTNTARSLESANIALQDLLEDLKDQSTNNRSA